MIIESEVIRKALFEFRHTAIVTQVDILLLDAAPEPFDEHIIQRPAHRGAWQHFFYPVEFYLQAADLFVQRRCQLLLSNLRGHLAMPEDLREHLQKLALPLADPGRVNLKLSSQFIRRLEALDRLQGYPGLEFRIVAFRLFVMIGVSFLRTLSAPIFTWQPVQILGSTSLASGIGGSPVASVPATAVFRLILAKWVGYALWAMKSSKPITSSPHWFWVAVRRLSHGLSACRTQLCAEELIFHRTTTFRNNILYCTVDHEERIDDGEAPW